MLPSARSSSMGWTPTQSSEEARLRRMKERLPRALSVIAGNAVNLVPIVSCKTILTLRCMHA
jgi:hypothetical protein